MAWRTTLGAVFGAAGLMLAQPGAMAQQAEPGQLESWLSVPVASGLAGARDAPVFAWIEYAAGVRNLWLGKPGSPARKLTDYREDDGQAIYDLTFTRDGGTLAWTRGGDDEFPDGSIPNTASDALPPAQQVFVLGLAGGGTPVAIGDGHSPAFSPDGARVAYTHKGEIWLWQAGGHPRKIAEVAGKVGDLTWSPDGSRLLFVDDRDDHAFVALLDVAAGRLSYVDPGLGTAVSPIFSPDGKQLAFIRYVDPPAGAAPDAGSYWSIRTADVTSGVARELWRAPAGMGGRYMGTRSRNLFWSAGGELVFPWEKTGWIHAWAIDATRGGAPRALTQGDFEVETFAVSNDGRKLVYTANAGDIERRHVWERPLAGDAAATQLTRGSGSESWPAMGGSQVGVIATDATHPGHPVLATNKLEPLGPAPGITGLTAPETVTFPAEDGVTVHAQLFRGKGPGKHPALIFVHGGPRRQMLPGFHPSLYYSNAYVLNQHFAAQGYDVLSVNYRSGTGYGLHFRDAPNIAREGASEYRDVIAAGRWLAARPEVDPARVGIWGGSWGGYLTALALARNSDVFAAGADFHGVHAMVRPVEKTLSPEQEARAHQLQWDSSPMGAIEGWRSPVLLVHGDDDHNVDFVQSLLLARALTARGVPFRELVFPNERHAFFRHASWLASYRATDAFFDRTLKRKEPLE